MTIARITELRELLRQARLSPTMQAEYDFASGELFAHHDELLSAADAVRRLLAACLLDADEALLQIKDIKDEETDNDVFSLRVETVLDGLDRSQPPARTDYAATLPHLDAGELADAGKLVGHGRRTP